MARVTTSTSGSSYSNTRSGGKNVSYNKYKPNKGLKSGLKNAEKAVKNYGPFNAPYQTQLNNTIDAINNSKFEYDVNKDALYQQYKEQYQAMGNQAMQEAQADATALTGGFANSYAQTAGQKAYNSYISQLQQLVPQLYQQARQTYDTDLSNMYNKANLYSSLNSQAWNEYSAGLDQLLANRDYAFNKYWNDRNAGAKTITKNGTWTRTSGGSSSSSTSSKRK